MKSQLRKHLDTCCSAVNCDWGVYWQDCGVNFIVYIIVWNTNMYISRTATWGMYTALHRCYNRGNTVIAGASQCVNLSWPPSLILAPLLVHHKFGRPVDLKMFWPYVLFHCTCSGLSWCRESVVSLQCLVGPVSLHLQYGYCIVFISSK